MQSIISFKERGPWGDSKYRGNCSGHVQKSLFEQFKSKEVTDPMAGSFTTRDVANAMNIISHCYDLSTGFNALTDEVPDECRGSDTWFWHPPYSEVIKIPYAGSMWDEKPFINQYGYDPKPFDLGQMPYDEFVKAMNSCLLKFYQAMEDKARMCILVGDIKRNGICHSMIRDLASVGTLENIVIKAQHNCVSDSKTYANNNFIPIIHEYIMIIKKQEQYIKDFMNIQYKEMTEKSENLYISDDVTWSVLIKAAMKNIERKKDSKNITIGEIAEEIRNTKKAEKNKYYTEKVRQVLREHNGIFKLVERGVYRVS